MIPESIIADLGQFREGISVRDFKPASGGCINNGGRIRTNFGDYFLKWNDSEKYPGMFETEFKGLNILREAGAIKIPEPLYCSVKGSHSYLLMEYIDAGIKSGEFFEQMGESLARLHKTTNTRFGLDHHNYIGSLPQENTWTDDWDEFFISMRIEPQVKIAVDSGQISVSDTHRFQPLFRRLSNLIPPETPSLLHGDLWSGNYMTDATGSPCLIDPAVYYGHREMDIAFSRLFGGFDPAFYRSYDEAYPREKGFEQRMDIYNLYPLLVHVNLFGGSYWLQVKSILKEYR